MAHVGVGNVPLEDRLLWAFDGALYVPVACDTAGNLVAAILAGSTIEVTQATAANLKALVNVNTGQTIAVTQASAADLKATVTIPTGQNIQAYNYGLWGGAQKAGPVPFGANAAVAFSASNTSLAAGSSTLVVATAPAGTVYVLTSLAMYYGGTSPTNIQLRITAGGTVAIVALQLSPVTLTVYDRQGWWVLGPGDVFDVRVTGATLNDDLFGYATGFSYSVA